MAKRKSAVKKAGLGAGIAAAAAAAAAAGYFFYGPEGKKHRKQTKAWALKARAEVLEQIERLKKISPQDYERIVERVLGKYEKLKSVSTNEAKDLKRDLKKHWNKISREAKK